VKQAMNESRFIDFNTLNNLKPQQINETKIVELFYAESVSIINFLIEKYGKYRFQMFIRTLKDKKEFNSALNSSYYDLRNLSDLGNIWEKYIKETN
jgi:hypothetical protein